MAAKFVKKEDLGPLLKQSPKSYALRLNNTSVIEFSILSLQTKKFRLKNLKTSFRVISKQYLLSLFSLLTRLSF